MNSRRFLLLSGAALSSFAAVPAWAKRKKAAAKSAASGDEGGPGTATAAVSTPADTPVGPVDTVASHAIVIDFNTNAVLLTKDADTPSPPSSLTKLMTIYITFTQLKAGKLTLGQTFTISEHAWHMGGSRMFLQVGTQVTIEDLIRGVFVDSGNDAAVALAEGIAGSEDAFVAMMNAEAKKLGMNDSHFMDASGWPADGHVMSVRDIATLATHIIRDFPDYYHYAGEQTFTYNKITQQNRNPLVAAGLGDGLKTGHTEEGGYSEAGSTERNGRRIIVVLNGLPTWDSRVTESKRLMDWAFNTFQDVPVFAAGQIVSQAPVWLGQVPTVGLTVQGGLTVTLPNNWRDGVKIAVDYPAPIPAPVISGHKVGQISLSGTGIPPGQIITTDLVAAGDVPRLGLPGRAMARLKHFITGA
ncbi:D-alanyl-D-alanine carboxypeptidase [Acidisoma cellulosilytica]|uniref:serine-type D-Ala-D-Ala carboxypeptidase n=1 Tax=Acidisoma cellulosilyticum TaxID=2802395 RepID=A0A963Z021_9PROT|nr:D-alanyl-D-alanine carboxypeptidase family protein [Acidisoma cellulosilyticum]MCB8879522.1 D-alanyl-D-alanine carboxypeptidase [Acidisoma cellulosilyticum]